MEDDLFLYCENENKSTAQITAHFGSPRDLAADFLAQTDPCTVSQFAYTRLRLAYFLLAMVILIALPVVTVNAVDYVKNQQLRSIAQTADTFVHPDGRVCDQFTVRTNFQGKDVYWEYHSCMGGLMLTIPPEDPNNSESYATDIYLNDNGTIEHWSYSDDNFHWIRVYDD